MGNVATFLRRFISKRDVRIIMVGLDGAGKTTIMYKMKLGESLEYPSCGPRASNGFNVETVEYNNVKFIVWDVGDQNRVGHLEGGAIMAYYQNTQGLIFVVDCNDRDRVKEAREELHRMLNEDELKDVVLLVFANKQVRTSGLSVFIFCGQNVIHNAMFVIDAESQFYFRFQQDSPNAMNAAELTDELDLHSLRQRNWYIQATCALTAVGLYEGLEWMSNQVAKL